VDFYDQESGFGNLLATWNLPPESYASFPPYRKGVQLFRSAVFHTAGIDHIDSLTNGALVIPEPVAGQLSLLGIVGICSLIALRRWLHSADYRTSGK
jgi:hypothetical protein